MESKQKPIMLCGISICSYQFNKSLSSNKYIPLQLPPIFASLRVVASTYPQSWICEKKRFYWCFTVTQESKHTILQWGKSSWLMNISTIFTITMWLSIFHLPFVNKKFSVILAIKSETNLKLRKWIGSAYVILLISIKPCI